VSKLTHLNDKGQAHMVDVSSKAPTERTAMAEASWCHPATLSYGAACAG
jgi:molybdenum cofactor biosynthesis enzyme